MGNPVWDYYEMWFVLTVAVTAVWPALLLGLAAQRRWPWWLAAVMPAFGSLLVGLDLLLAAGLWRPAWSSGMWQVWSFAAPAWVLLTWPHSRGDATPADESDD